MKSLRAAALPFITSAGISLLLPVWLVWSNALPATTMRTVLSAWDAFWLLRLADHGYPAYADAQAAFFPGYPLLVWLVGRLTHDTVMAAVIVSLTATLVAMAYIGALARRELPEPVANYAVWLVALFPTALFLSNAYTDSCFMAAAAASLYYARAGKPWPAAIAAMFAGSFRLFGLALLPALAWECWRQGADLRRWASLLVAPLGVAAYMVFLYVHTGDALAFAHAEGTTSFGLHLMAPWTAAWSMLHSGSPAIFYPAVGFGLAAFALVVLAWVKRMPVSLTIYLTLVVLLATSINNWRSMGRYDLALFPLALLVAQMTANHEGLRRGILALSAVALALSVYTWTGGGWVG